jgi:ApeA N-terminal domain 1
MIVEPGSYNARFHLHGRAFSGAVNLEARKPVSFEIYDPDGISKSGEFPRVAHVDRLVGHLWSNEDIILRHLQLSEIFPGRYIGVANYALVGLGIQEVEDSLCGVDFQVEGLDEFFWTRPLKQYQWPRDPSSSDFSATMMDGTDTTWSSADLTITAGYPWKNEHLDGYSLSVTFAPVMTFESTNALSPDDWVAQWLRPFLRLISFGTTGPRRPSWVVFYAQEDESRQTVRAQLYGLGITQDIHTAQRPMVYGLSRRPLFTRHDLPTQLPDLVKKWDELESSNNPFLELYRLASDPDLPPRAHFLYLVQALEGLHGFEHRTEDDRRQAAHEAAREELITEIDERLGRQLSRRVKKMLDKRAHDSLDRRIKGILDMTPRAVVEHLEYHSDDPIGSYYSEGRHASFQEVVRRLRNDLSHGNYNPDAEHLRSWIERLDRLAQAQLLRLLGFSAELIVSRLGR